MSMYGAEFDRLTREWSVIENAHDREHPDRSECGGVGACMMMRAAVDLEHRMVEALERWRRGATDPTERPESSCPCGGDCETGARITRRGTTVCLNGTHMYENGGWSCTYAGPGGCGAR